MSHYPIARNVHDAGILAESVAPGAGRPPRSPSAPTALGERLAWRWASTGTLTAELFLMRRRPARRQRARAARPQQRPLDDRGRGDLAVRAARPGDLRPGARRDEPLGADRAWSTCWAPAPSASGAPRRALGRRALGDPGVHLHLYDKRQVFERRKMGHVTAIGRDPDEALRAPAARRDELRWATTQEPTDDGWR